MKEAADFLVSLATAISTMALYEEGHPQRERAVDRVHDGVRRLQEASSRPRFTFLGGDVVLDGRPVPQLREWDWGGRLAGVGIQRIELTGPVTRDDLEVFLQIVHDRLHGSGPATAEARPARPTAIRYGMVGLPGAEGDRSRTRSIATATPGFDLAEEYDAVGWLHEELRDRRRLHLLEAEVLVRSLSVAMHGDQEFLIPLLRLKEFDQYTTTHALNVSVLAMALAEFIGLGPAEVRTFGIAGLLHDIGKVEIPAAILTKPGKLTEEERTVMNRHPVAGARLILRSEERLDLAAVVAYEHHMRVDGGGYPSFRYRRPCHQASDLVHVCDVFDALRTDRPYRAALPQEQVLGILQEGAGTEFDAALARGFVSMVRQWSDRLRVVASPTESLDAASTPETADLPRPGPDGPGEGAAREAAAPPSPIDASPDGAEADPGDEEAPPAG